MSTKAYAVRSAESPLAPFSISRRDPLANDVAIEILYCGVCHSDLHQARNEWHNTIYPCVPGHEIVGRVTRVGSRVTRFKPGDLSAVGQHDINAYLSLLKLDGTLTLVGAPE